MHLAILLPLIIFFLHLFQNCVFSHRHTHTHTHPFNGPFSGTTQVSRYQKGKTNLDFTEARDSEWQWHQVGHMQVCTSLQADNHASTPPLSFLQAGCPSCRPTNSVKALKAIPHTETKSFPILFNTICSEWTNDCMLTTYNKSIHNSISVQPCIKGQKK